MLAKKETHTYNHNFFSFKRRLSWLQKSGVFSLGIEHFLAMIPSTILVPLLVNNTLNSNIVDISLVLFTSGLGTILFTLISNGKIPAYVSSSFSYIGLTIYLIEENMEYTSDLSSAYVYVGWSYIFSGILLIGLSFIYRINGIAKILTFLLPASVMGPAISLIGLELADTAIIDSGFDIAKGMVNSQSAIISVTTLITIVLFSLIRRKFLKNSAIIIGIIVGCLVYIFFKGLPDINISDIGILNVPRFKFPIFTLPPNLDKLFISVIPATLVVFTENIGRVTIIERMVNGDTIDDKQLDEESIELLNKGLFSHGIASIFSTFIGSVPNTIYAENIAVMSIHRNHALIDDPDPFVKKLLNPYSSISYIIAALISIAFSFIGALQTLLMAIPKPVIGGMELFLFGIISAPGIQILVEQKVDYRKISNQILTAAVLISGISGLTLNLWVVELKGMSLGFAVGIILNLLIQALKWFGNISDIITFEEVLNLCLQSIDKKSNIVVKIPQLTKDINNFYKPIELYKALNSDKTFYQNTNMPTNLIRNSIMCYSPNPKVSFCIDNNEDIMILEENCTRIALYIKKDVFDNETKTMLINDYKDALNEDEKYLHILISQTIPMRKIRKIVKTVSYISCSTQL